MQPPNICQSRRSTAPDQKRKVALPFLIFDLFPCISIGISREMIVYYRIFHDLDHILTFSILLVMIFSSQCNCFISRNISSTNLF